MDGLRAVTGSRWEEDRSAVLVAGDFNAHDAQWGTAESAGKSNSAGRRLSHWMGAQGWALGLEPGTATRGIGSKRGGAALDLVFLSPALQRLDWVAECRTRPDLATGADHEAVWTELQARVRAEEGEEGRLAEHRTDPETFAAELRSLLPALTPLTNLAHQAAQQRTADAHHTIDTAVEAWQNAIQAALAASTPRSSGRRGGYVWWNKECTASLSRLVAVRQALPSYRSRQRWTQEVLDAKKDLRKTTTRAKRQWGQDKIAALQGNDIFGAMKWSSGRRRYRSPPLKDATGNLVTTAEEKMTTLRETLLPVPPPTNLPALDLHSALPHTLPDTPLTEHEVHEALFSQNPQKAAGPDEVGFRTLRLAWPIAKDTIVRLVEAALRVGWHPTSFRQSTLVALKKGGNRDPAEPRSYRLISLLPCLGKVLEKIVARRLTFYAQNEGWVPPEQFGGMPGCCTTDAGLTLIHDVEAAWAQTHQRILSALACDVRGAFDMSHPDRIVDLLYRLGCPLHLVRWVKSFLTDRVAAVRLDGDTSPMRPVQTGVPQGSPVSPILFIIFLSPLLRLFGPRSADLRLRKVRMIGYIDDGLMYTTSLDAHQNCRTLEYAYETAERWILGVGLSFDQQKRELIHFYPPYLRKPKRPDIQPAVTLNGVDVAALRDGDTVRWLGFHLDNKLSFQGHVRIMCAKARKAAQCMRMLVNTVRGLRAHDARRLYVGCVLPIMTYGTAVWWRSRTREEPSRSPTGIAQRVNHRGTVTMLDKLGREQSYALRMVLPVWRTTSTNALLIESGCMPIEFYLDRILDRSAIRLSTLPLNHTLLRRAGAFDIADGESPALRNKAQRPPFKLDTSAEAARRKRRFSTRLTILARRCPPTIEREQWLRPPWWTPIGALHQVEIVPRSAFPEDKKEAGLQVCEEVWRRWEEVRVFTDGSRMEDGNTGVGWVIYRGDREVRVAAVSTGPRMEVFDAEVLGLLWGFDTAFRYAREQDVKTITVYCDNTAAIQAISSGQGTSSLPHIKSLDKRIRSWLRGDQGNRLRISWVPGHVGVTGNERADDLAKVGATRGGAMVHPTTSISYAKRVVNERATKAWQSAWETALTGRSSWYQSTRVVCPSHRSPLTLTLARRDLGTLLQIRTGHGDFADYHERFGHENAILTCVCGDPRAPLHPLECPVFAVHRPLLQDEDGRSLTHEQLLNDKKGIRALLAFARASRAYERDTYMHEDEVHG